MLQTLALSVFFCAAVSGAAAENGQPLDLAAFGRLMAWKDIDTPQTTELKSWGDLPADSKCVGVEWNEERDVSEIRARFAGGVELEGVTIQYWFNT
jgi:hypothetical protein